MVEFALALPLLMILLLGIADFGRVFTAGITIEAAARNAAEVVALERLRERPPLPADPTEIDYYRRLHLLAAQTACAEARQLPNTTFDAATRSCNAMPVVAVCVHDGQDPVCDWPIPGFAEADARCPRVDHMEQNPFPTSGGETASHFVQVGVCYHFTTLFNLDLQLPMGASLSLGDIWIERVRSFVVDCLPQQVGTC